MSRLVRKLWNSPTITQWLDLLTKPLRLFLLTPLILTTFPPEDIDAFYILASVGGFAALAVALLPGVFQPVFVYYFGGARNLEEVGAQGRKGGSPNWEGFAEAFATLGRIQRRLLIPLVVFVSAILYAALTRKFGSDGVASAYLIAAGLLVLRSVLDLMVGRFGAALRSIGCVAMSNRVNVAYSATSVLLASFAIFLGGGLVAMVGAQLAVSSVQRMHIAAIVRRRIPGLGEGRYSSHVYSHVRRPFRRATFGVLFSVGVERLMPALLAGSLIGGIFATYAVAMTLAVTILTASRGMLASQMPAYIKLYAEGDLKLLEERGTHRVGLSTFAFILAFVIIGPFFAWFLQLTGSKVEFVSVAQWSLIGMLLLCKHLSLSFAMLYNVTNERPFYLRVIAGGTVQLILLAGLWITGAQIGLWNAILITVLPQVVALNWAPLIKFSRLTSKSVRSIVADVILSMRPDRVVLHVHRRIFAKEPLGPVR